MSERRSNVRVRPAIDYDVVVDWREGVVSVRLSVLDVSAEGLGLVVDEMFAHKKSGDTLTVGIHLPHEARFEVRAEVRYTTGKAGGKCGLLLVGLTEPQRSSLGRAVGELLERGNSA